MNGFNTNGDELSYVSITSPKGSNDHENCNYKAACSVLENLKLVFPKYFKQHN